MLTYIQRMTKELIEDYEVTTHYDAKRKAYAIEKLKRDIELSASGESTDDIQIGDNDDEQDKGDESDDDNRSRLYHPWETEW